MTGVEGVPQRDVPVTFTRHFWSYNAGEVACFHDHEAQELIDRGVAEAVEEPEPPNGENGGEDEEPEPPNGGENGGEDIET